MGCGVLEVLVGGGHNHLGGENVKVKRILMVVQYDGPLLWLAFCAMLFMSPRVGLSVCSCRAIV